MANTSTAGYGLRAVMTVGNTPATSGQSEYQIYGQGATTGSAVTSKTFFKGDLVSINDGTGAVAGQKGYIQDASYSATDDAGGGGADFDNSASPLLVGVFNGAHYVAASTSKPTWSNSFDIGTTVAIDYNTGSRGVVGFVIDNPNQEYNIRANAAWQQNDVGLAYNTGSNGATGVEGQSDERLSISTVATTAALTLVRNANIPDQKDQTVAGSDVVVTIAKASALYN